LQHLKLKYQSIVNKP